MAARLVTHSVYALAGALLLAAGSLALPSSVAIQLQSVAANSTTVSLYRTVTVPVYAYYLMEFERVSPPPPLVSISCTREGYTYFERRTEPFTFEHGCDFDGPENSRWLYTLCVRVEGMFGIRLRTSCVSEYVTGLDTTSLRKELDDLNEIVKGSSP